MTPRMLSFFKHLVRYWWVWAALIALLEKARYGIEGRTGTRISM